MLAWVVGRAASLARVEKIMQKRARPKAKKTAASADAALARLPNDRANDRNLFNVPEVKRQLFGCN